MGQIDGRVGFEHPPQRSEQHIAVDIPLTISAVSSPDGFGPASCRNRLIVSGGSAIARDVRPDKPVGVPARPECLVGNMSRLWAGPIEG